MTISLFIDKSADDISLELTRIKEKYMTTEPNENLDWVNEQMQITLNILRGL